MASMILLSRCANQQAPTGGPRDTIPPTLISSIPKDQSTNYKGKIIKLEFDEAIDAKDVRKDLIITPLSDVIYNTRVKKNTLILEFNEELEPNTTYTLNFQQSIGDLNENNKTEPISIAFSTGSEIDSMYVSGKITDLMSGKKLEKASVALYPYTDDTLNIEGNKPYYLTKTDKEGRYILQNLKPGIYKIFALAKEGQNIRYNERGDKIAFLSEDLEINRSIDSLDFKVTDFDSKDLEFIRPSNKNHYVELGFNKTIVDYTVKPLEAKYDGLIIPQGYGDILRLYNLSENTTDSIEVFFSATDSILNKIEDTVKVLFEPLEKEKDKASFSITGVFPKETSMVAGQTFDMELQFDKPVSSFNLDKIQFAVDGDTTSATGLFEHSMNAYRTSFVFHNLSYQQSLSARFDTASFISIESDTSYLKTASFSVKDKRKFGSIAGTVTTNHPSFIIQLLDNNYKVEAEIKNQKQYRFDYVAPGEKILRILIDENQNGKWDKGSFNEKILPEDVYIQPGTINIKANWEIKNVKETTIVF
ncbi:Ig-like domain-containing protein [Rapidithrix thailandica]|uniref:Ig-like domain-containing protein n=1 Tax=Rapidithrix thailandica TaxID=413964 RepID=A0AAW9RSG4_9BACT